MEAPVWKRVPAWIAMLGRHAVMLLSRLFDRHPLYC